MVKDTLFLMVYSDKKDKLAHDVLASLFFILTMTMVLKVPTVKRIGFYSLRIMLVFLKP